MARNTSEAKPEKKEAILKCPVCGNEDTFYWSETIQSTYSVEVEDGVISVDKSYANDSDEQYSGLECGMCDHSFDPSNTEIRFDY